MWDEGGRASVLAQAMTHHIDADLHQILAAHFIAVLGCLWLIGLTLTLPMRRYGDTGRRRLVLLTAIPAYGDWGVTAVKSFPGG